MALAYFITFTTYGTWLHGTERGSVDNGHNVHGTPLLEADAERERSAFEAMAQTPYVMSQAEQEIVCQAILDLARERGWLLLAVHVRTNHVHVVVSTDRDPGRIMSDLKGRASRDLTSAGFDTKDRKRWTRHGSTKHLFHEHEVETSVRYTLDGQGEPMARFPKEPRTQ